MIWVLEWKPKTLVAKAIQDIGKDGKSMKELQLKKDKIINEMVADMSSLNVLRFLGFFTKFKRICVDDKDPVGEIVSLGNSCK